LMLDGRFHTWGERGKCSSGGNTPARTSPVLPAFKCGSGGGAVAVRFGAPGVARRALQATEEQNGTCYQLQVVDCRAFPAVGGVDRGGAGSEELWQRTSFFLSIFVFSVHGRHGCGGREIQLGSRHGCCKELPAWTWRGPGSTRSGLHRGLARRERAYYGLASFSDDTHRQTRISRIQLVTSTCFSPTGVVFVRGQPSAQNRPNKRSDAATAAVRGGREILSNHHR